VEIRPRVPATSIRVAFYEGGQVKRGDLLFVIDPRPYQAETDRAAADLKRYKNFARPGAHRTDARAAAEGQWRCIPGRMDERKSTVAQAEANSAGAAACARSCDAQFEFHAGHQPDSRARSAGRK